VSGQAITRTLVVLMIRCLAKDLGDGNSICNPLHPLRTQHYEHQEVHQLDGLVLSVLHDATMCEPSLQRICLVCALNVPQDKAPQGLTITTDCTLTEEHLPKVPAISL